MPTQIETASNPWKKVRRVNQTGSFPSRVPTKTDPRLGLESAGTATSQDVMHAGLSASRVGGLVGAASQNQMQLAFYGTGADNATMLARLYGWAYVQPYDNDSNKNQWLPTLVAGFSLVLSAALPGIAGTQVVATELFADTVTIVIGNPAKVIVTSPGSTTADVCCACAECDFTGFQLLEVVFDTNSSATDCNALCRVF